MEPEHPVPHGVHLPCVVLCHGQICREPATVDQWGDSAVAAVFQATQKYGDARNCCTGASQSSSHHAHSRATPHQAN